MRILFFFVLAGALLWAGDHEAVLYERGVRLVKAGKWEQGLLTLETLVRAYPKTTLRGPAEAAQLFGRAQMREEEGKREAALLTWETLTRVYPKSEFAERARKEMERLAGK